MAANLQPLNPIDPDSLSTAIYGTISSTISSTTTTTPGSWHSFNYPGVAGAGTGIGSTVTPAEDFNALKDRMNELQEKLTNKTHIDVSKNQEERICELESAVAELMEDNKNMKTWIERQKQEDISKIIEARLDMERHHKNLLDSLAKAQVIPTPTGLSNLQKAVKQYGYQQHP